MEHCRGSLVREGGSLESYWCSAPQEFKSLPRRKETFFFKKISCIYKNALGNTFLSGIVKKSCMIVEGTVPVAPLTATLFIMMMM